MSERKGKRKKMTKDAVIFQLKEGFPGDREAHYHSALFHFIHKFLHDVAVHIIRADG